MTIARHQSCAERRRKYGPLVPMERPLKDQGTGFEHLGIWDEQPSILKATAWGAAFLIIYAIAWSLLP